MGNFSPPMRQGFSFERTPAGKTVATGIANARVGIASTQEGMLYVAPTNGAGSGGRPKATISGDIPAPGLGDTYNAMTDSDRRYLAGAGNQPRWPLDLRQAQPTIKILGPKDGLIDGWVQIFVLDGVARFLRDSWLCRFDETTRTFR